MKRLLSFLLILNLLLSLCVFAAASDEPETPEEDEPAALVEAVYPSMAPRPNQEDYLKENGWDVDDAYYEAQKAWWADLRSFRSQPEGYADFLEPWLRDSLRQFLCDADGENRVFSPLSLTMALAMLAEVTDGESRQQLLDLLGVEDLEALRETAAALWQQSYQDDGQTASLLASSFWLSDKLSYEQPALENLSAYYYASAFRGQMGSPEYDELLQSWINEQTGGLLEEQASGLRLDPDTVLALVSTIYFKAPWNGEFSSYFTREGIFRGPDGEERVPFLHGSSEMSWYWGEHFSAVGLGMGNGGAMWFLLPEEGLTPEELLRDEELMDFMLLQDKDAWEKQKYPLVNLTIPKFDVSSDLELSDGLQSLGLTDVFDSDVSDFSPLTTDLQEIYVSSVKHAARVKIDEEGCEAAAYTIIEAPGEGAAMEEPEREELDFVLDRPFLFVLTNAGGLPLFAGVVNHPAE